MEMENHPYIFYESHGTRMVIGTDYRRIDDYMDSLVQELKSMRYQGDIYFDFLLSNGNNSKRYFKAYFNGTNFDFNSFAILNPQKELVEISTTFFTNNSSMLSNGILSTREIDSLRDEFHLEFA